MTSMSKTGYVRFGWAPRLVNLRIALTARSDDIRWSLFRQIFYSSMHESLDQWHRPAFSLKSLSDVTNLPRQIFCNNVFQQWSRMILRICHWFRRHKFYIRVQLVIWGNALPNTDHAGTWRLVETQAIVRVALYRSIRWECRYRKNQRRLWSLLSLLLMSVCLSISDVISSDTPGLRSTSQSHHLETGIRTSNM